MSLSAPISALASQARAQVRHAGSAVGLMAVLVLIGLTGVGFLMAALYIVLARATDPLLAALIIGGTLTAVAAIWAAILAHGARKRRRMEQRTRTNTALVTSSLSIANAGLRILSRSKGPMFWPAVATLAAAFYMTRSGSDDQDD